MWLVLLRPHTPSHPASDGQADISGFSSGFDVLGCLVSDLGYLDFKTCCAWDSWWCIYVSMCVMRFGCC
ncbi:hypothetical protein BO70DRAFT_127408 [Aspergillus heteromorphus CBS 117.55]|uniref:Uncharacterized protein n=1 Tax=Aspergillus heteromorphus CBS 117.55 TaxID=1448321 RepID=A0A317WTL8_9EURO|nr:uncharacterized protein BO70DRAFT_127408 [Aspergillus heteromorphus CBS 117.55]PWY89744.1 hypothetical protein BO70DRAFT_127408 [Aspergillus heteromorphus CBS 117.55]